jgi:hypothetical protein
MRPLNTLSGLIASASVVAATCVGVPPAAADPPPTINIRGTLVDSAGAPLSGSRVGRIRFFDAEVAGLQLGGDVNGTAEVGTDGVFNFPIVPPAAALAAAEAWYEVAIDTDVPSDGNAADDVFLVRIQLHSVPFALLAADSVKLGGQAASAYATNAEVSGAFLPLIGGTLSGPLTAPSIKTDSMTEKTTNHGVKVEGLVIKDGGIGINTTSPTHPLDIRRLDAPMEDQAQTVQSTTDSGTLHWQEFTGILTGNLTRIEFKNVTGAGFSGTLSIQLGGGNEADPTVFHSQPITLGAAGVLNGYDLTQFVPVSGGVLYNWRVSGFNSSIQLATNSGNPYAGGESSAGAAKDYVFKTFVAFVRTGLVFTTAGNLGVGTSVFGTGAKHVLAIQNGAVPTNSPANLVQVYAEKVSAKSELRVRDENGFVTTLSPHNFSLAPKSEPMAWSFYSENSTAGKAINVDMLRAMRVLERVSGEELVYIKDLDQVVEPSDEKQTFPSNEGQTQREPVLSPEELSSEVRRLKGENESLRLRLENLMKKLDVRED